MRDQFDFRMTVENQPDTGAVIAVYFQIRKGKSATTKEYADGNLFADYDRKGRLLGVEMLAPCEAAVLTRIAKQAPARRFLTHSIPREMLVGA